MPGQPDRGEQANGRQIFDKINLLQRHQKLANPHLVKIDSLDAKTDRVARLIMYDPELYSGNGGDSYF